MPTRTPARTSRPAAPRRAGGATPEGVVTAIVSVTGTVDSGNDVIVPGAYAATLLARRPKVVHHHDFAAMAGRVLHVEELLPGDSRLPGSTPQGNPWPAAAGALVATMQFNMGSEQGRETYSAAAFYSASDECQWSVGYRVPPGQSAKRGDTRMIYGLELYEISLVAVGMHDGTMTLEVKHGAPAGLERKASPVAGAARQVVVGEAADALVEAKALNSLTFDPKYDTGTASGADAGLTWEAVDALGSAYIQRKTASKMSLDEATADASRDLYGDPRAH